MKSFFKTLSKILIFWCSESFLVDRFFLIFSKFSYELLFFTTISHKVGAHEKLSESFVKALYETKRNRYVSLWQMNLPIQLNKLEKRAYNCKQIIWELISTNMSLKIYFLDLLLNFFLGNFGYEMSVVKRINWKWSGAFFIVKLRPYYFFMLLTKIVTSVTLLFY